MASHAAAVFLEQMRPSPGNKDGSPPCEWAFTLSSWRGLAIKELLTIQPFSHQPNRLFLAQTVLAWPNTDFHIFNQYVSETNGGADLPYVLHSVASSSWSGTQGPTHSLQTPFSIKIHKKKSMICSSDQIPRVLFGCLRQF